MIEEKYNQLNLKILFNIFILNLIDILVNLKKKMYELFKNSCVHLLEIVNIFILNYIRIYTLKS